MRIGKVVVLLTILIVSISTYHCFAGTIIITTVPSRGDSDTRIDLITPAECEHLWIHYSISPGYLEPGKEYDQCIYCGVIKNEKTTAGYCYASAKKVKLKNSRNAFIVSWTVYNKKLLKNISGYQIRYSFHKNMKNAKYIKVGRTRTSRKIRVKSGRRYYVQVRTYKLYKGNMFYSKWSKIKSIKTE